ncbi:MAG: hypothetical protein MUE63_00095 [Xanthomonadales bacterium]|jgi:hypothetical protein|nr:hypothetical protein [Xanthomonadales bacterium]
MRAFNVTIRQAGRVIRFAALARCSCDVLASCLECIADGEAFSICVRGCRHAQH